MGIELAETTLETTPQVSATSEQIQAPVTTPVPASGIPEGHWASGLDENLRESETVKTLMHEMDATKVLNKVVKMYENVQPLIGTKAPSPDASDEELLSFRGRSGAPSEYKAFEPVSLPDGSTMQLPEEVEDLVKQFCVARKLPQKDYDAGCNLYSSIIQKSPEICKETLVADFGALGEAKISQQCDFVLNMVPQNSRIKAEQTILHNPVFKEVLSSLAQRFSESQITSSGQQPVQTTAQGTLESNQQQIDKLTAEVTTKSIELGNPHHPDVVELNKKLDVLYGQNQEIRYGK